MKMKLKFVLWLFLALLFLAGCNQNSPDPDVVFPTETMEKVLTYDETTACVTDFGGISTRYTVDATAVSTLESLGYTVVYGVVSALGTQEEATVTKDGDTGYRSVAGPSATVVAYATGAPAYVSAFNYTDGFSRYAVGALSTDDEGAVVFTTVYESADSEKYSAEFVSVGFVAVIDGNGNQSIVYERKENKTSMLSLADRLVNEYAGDTIDTYYYNQNATLRGVLNACGKEVRTLDAPIAISQNTTPTLLSSALAEQYVAEARAAYRTEAYADHTTSLVGNYATTASKMNDIPLPQKLRWVYRGEEELTFTVAIATDAAFTKNVRTYKTKDTVLEVYNLFTDMTYYVKVSATSKEGHCYECISTFKTAPSVRWIYVDGVRNVRDIGGWTGLNQGLVYRGSELNQTQSYGTAITAEGIRVMRKELGIKTHLDFRPASSNGQFGTRSPIGDGVTWENHTISAFLNALQEGSNYASAMKVFADYDNYPIYMHCVGGADRTGTAAFMIEGLCGVEEADLSVDLELTSFSKFGYRYRYNNDTYVYADLIACVKEYSGDTLQEKFETVFREVYDFSEAEISNVQAILTQSGAVYDFEDGDNGDVSVADMMRAGEFSFSFVMRESTTVSSVTVDGIALDFTFDTAEATVTVDGSALRGAYLPTGIGTIVFDDGATLRFSVL